MRRTKPYEKWEDDKICEAYACEVPDMRTLQCSLPHREKKSLIDRAYSLRKAGKLNTNSTPIEDVKADGEQFEFRAQHDDGILTCRSKTVRTLNDALKEAEVDLSIWEVERYVVNKWDNVARIERSGGDQLAATELWQVKVWLRKKRKTFIDDAREMLLKDIKKHAPKYPKIRPTKLTDPHLLEISIFDAHFGKLAWGQETGTDYDLKIAENLFHEAVVDITRMASSFDIETILFPLGQDFFNIDNQHGETAAGTRVDTDSRYPKIYATGVRACVHAIDYLLTIAPVEVIWVPGNHDKTTSWHLCHDLASWYWRCDRVAVDWSPSSRKFRRYGKCLLGFTHGSEEPHRDLPAIMASEAPIDWAKSQYREWHLGHRHKKKETHFVAGDTHGGGIVVRLLPSLSGTDKWHYDKGYVKGLRAAEAYLWNRERGLRAYLVSSVQQEPNETAHHVI